jgi:hypothetical protein
VRHRPHDRPAAGLDVDPLDPDHLRLPLAPALVERLQQRGVGAAQPGRHVEVHPPRLEGLADDVGAPEAAHGGVVHAHHLRRQHAFERVRGPHPGQGRERGELLRPLHHRVGVGPVGERARDLVGEDEGELGGVAAAEVLLVPPVLQVLARVGGRLGRGLGLAGPGLGLSH